MKNIRACYARSIYNNYRSYSAASVAAGDTTAVALGDADASVSLVAVVEQAVTATIANTATAPTNIFFIIINSLLFHILYVVFYLILCNLYMLVNICVNFSYNINI